MPNVPDRPNSSGTRLQGSPTAGVARVLAAFDRFQLRLMSVHAAEFTGFELTMAQAKLMYVVIVGGELSLSEIAQRLGISLSTASGAVERLVELGLLSRAAVPTNRRRVSVAATELGVQAIEQLHELGSRQMRSFLANVPAADLPTIERAITILADAIPADDPPSVSGVPGRAQSDHATNQGSRS